MDLALSQRIKEFIEFKKITQEAFGKPIGVGKSSVGQWVNGKTEPSAAKKIQILKVYSDLNPRWFLFGMGGMTNNVKYEPDDSFGSSIKEDSPLYRLIERQQNGLDDQLRELLEAKDGLIKMQTKHIESLEQTIHFKDDNMFTKKEHDQAIKVAVSLAIEKLKGIQHE